MTEQEAESQWHVTALLLIEMSSKPTLVEEWEIYFGNVFCFVTLSSCPYVYVFIQNICTIGNLQVTDIQDLAKPLAGSSVIFPEIFE